MAKNLKISPIRALNRSLPFHSHQLEKRWEGKTRRENCVLFGSQPAFSKWLFLLDDDKPIKKIMVRKPTYQKWWLENNMGSAGKLSMSRVAATTFDTWQESPNKFKIRQ